MRTRETAGRLLICALVLIPVAVAQEPASSVTDTFKQRVAAIQLTDQTIVDGVAILSHSAALGVSVEYQLGSTISAPAPPLKRYTSTVGPGTVSELLDRLCELDQTFTWVRNRNMANILPRSLANDPSYFLNRRIAQLTLNNVRDAHEAVFKLAEQLPGPKEQIAIFQPGMSLNFAHPWTETVENVTVREMFDHIAEQFGPTYGWQFSGAQNFRTITFHEAILPKPSLASTAGSPSSKSTNER
jgi:hypothetical protein